MCTMALAPQPVPAFCHGDVPFSTGSTAGDEWVMPYAERAFARFPEVMLALGHPLVPEAFNLLPSQSEKRWTEVKEWAGQKVIRVSLGRRAGDDQQCWQSTQQNEGLLSAEVHAWCAAALSQLPSAATETALQLPRPQAVACNDFPAGHGLDDFSITDIADTAAGAHVTSNPPSRARSFPQQAGADEAAACQSALELPVPRFSPIQAPKEIKFSSTPSFHPLTPDAVEPDSPRSPGHCKAWSSSSADKCAQPKKSIAKAAFAPPPRVRNLAKFSTAPGPTAAEPDEPDSPRSPKRFTPWAEDEVKTAPRCEPAQKPTPLMLPIRLKDCEKTSELAPKLRPENDQFPRPPVLGTPSTDDSIPMTKTSSSNAMCFTLSEGKSEDDSGTPIFGAATPGSPASRTSHSSISMDRTDTSPSRSVSPDKASAQQTSLGFSMPLTIHSRQQSLQSTSSLSPVSSISGKSSLKARRGVDLTLRVKHDEEASPKAPASPSNSDTVDKAAERMTAAKTDGAVVTRRKRRGGFKDPSKYLSGGLACHSPENKQPAVQLMSSRHSKDKDEEKSRDSSPNKTPSAQSFLRPLPGSFPNRRTVFIFDWDDTLCPTSWIRNVLKTHIADLKEWEPEVSHEEDWRDAIPGWFSHHLPDDHSIHEWMEDLVRAVIAVINVAQAFGVVCIVTNAIPGWVEQTIKKWLPKLTQYIYGHGARPPIKVIYGQQAYRRPTGAAAELSWVNELGPYMWWKKAAMTQALDDVDELYRVDGCGQTNEQEVLPSLPLWANGDCKRLANVVSVGDNEAEMQAAELAAMSYDDRRSARHRASTKADGSSHIHHESSAGGVAKPSHWPWVKLMKLKECPHVKQLTAQLEEIAELLPQVVTMRSHSRLELDGSDRLETPRTPCSPFIRSKLFSKLRQDDASSAWVERSLRMQLV